jgi:hypothetical protein
VESKNLVRRFLAAVRALVALGTGPLNALQPASQRRIAHDAGHVGRGAAQVAKTQFLGVATAISGFGAETFAAVGRWRRRLATSMQHSVSFFPHFK